LDFRLSGGIGERRFFLGAKENDTGVTVARVRHNIRTIIEVIDLENQYLGIPPLQVVVVSETTTTGGKSNRKRTS
jgi:hypothetical protein